MIDVTLTGCSLYNGKASIRQIMQRLTARVRARVWRRRGRPDATGTGNGERPQSHYMYTYNTTIWTVSRESREQQTPSVRTATSRFHACRKARPGGGGTVTDFMHNEFYGSCAVY
jgi:hypothetical protein